MKRIYQVSKTNKSVDGRTLLCDIPSYLGAAEGMCKLVRHFIQQLGLPDLAFATEIVVRECLNNAINHGNRCDPNKRIRVSMVAENDGVRLRVADQGEGFDWKRFEAGPCPETMTPSGRGLAMVATYSKRVSFNRKGNVITVDVGNTAPRSAKR